MTSSNFLVVEATKTRSALKAINVAAWSEEVGRVAEVVSIEAALCEFIDFGFVCLSLAARERCFSALAGFWPDEARRSSS